jgi:hypothetical protein
MSQYVPNTLTTYKHISVYFWHVLWYVDGMLLVSIEKKACIWHVLFGENP